MLKQFKSERVNRSRVDFILTALIVLLLGLGLCVIYSVTYVDREIGGGGLQTFEKQLIVSIIFFIFDYAILSNLDLKKFRDTKWILLFTMAMAILLILPISIGSEVKGAQRWIFIGSISLQPSEFLKPFIVFFMAHMLDRKQSEMANWKGILNVLIIPIVFLLFVLLGRDFSTSMVIMAALAVMFWLGGMPKRWFFSIAAVVVLICGLYIGLNPYAKDRIVDFIEPQTEMVDSGRDQDDLALNYWRLGGFWGEGLGINVMRKNGIPEAQSDFVLATISRSIGVFGILMIFLLFTLLGWRSFYLSYRLKENRFYYLLGVGSISMLLIQFMLNLAVNASLVPTTGIPCPFFSTGASSLISTMVLSGFLMAISKHVGEVRCG